MGAPAKNVVPESSNSSQVGFGNKKPVASEPAPSRAQHPFSSPAHTANHPVAPLPREVREAFVDAKGAGEFLQLNWRTVQKWAREGSIPAHPFGSGRRKTWRFLLSELHEWVLSLKNEACK
ncbi:MAG TPA: helix-turn-helix domain-containing protein [Terriglobales bacterium]|nr:helix-turn-helix domain-containing protein [Terriglobales bacterium]